MNESRSHSKSSARFLFIQQLQAEKTEPIWRSQESEDCSFCIVLLSLRVANQTAFCTENFIPPKTSSQLEGSL